MFTTHISLVVRICTIVNIIYYCSCRCKTFVAIDGFNSFFYPLTRLSTPTKKKVKPEEVTLTTTFMELTKNDWVRVFRSQWN